MKAIWVILLLVLIVHFRSTAQCIAAPAAPDCNGTEPLVSEGEIISGGVTKWYYGSTATYNSLSLDGGTLVVCGDLTVDKFYISTGTIFIREGARFVIGSGIGSGLQFKGNCAIYNYGTCEILRNLSLEDTASAVSPNIVVNATPASVFKLSNQYFVINNPFSWFVNNGNAEFWGLITDQHASASSVCLGNASSTRMAILINKVPDTYLVSGSYACLNVYQYSEFYGKLSSSVSLFACLGSSHSSGTSCVPFGCQPNNWGSAQVIPNCSGCAALSVLSINLTNLKAERMPGGFIQLQWDFPAADPGFFIISRSEDEKNFTEAGRLPVEKNKAAHFFYTDRSPVETTCFYRISYLNPKTGLMNNSKIIKVNPFSQSMLTVYPQPFTDLFMIRFPDGDIPEKIVLTDITGRNIPVNISFRRPESMIQVTLPGSLLAGLYILHIKTAKKIMSRTVLKK